MPLPCGNCELSCVAISPGVPVLGLPYPERDLAGNSYSTPRRASGRLVMLKDVVDLGHLVGEVVAPDAEVAPRVVARYPKTH